MAPAGLDATGERDTEHRVPQHFSRALAISLLTCFPRIRPRRAAHANEAIPTLSRGEAKRENGDLTFLGFYEFEGP